MDEIKKIDGFKFAITLIFAFASIIYMLYNYLQTTFINNTFIYLFIILSIATLFTSLVFLIFYVYFRGFSFELNDDDNNKKRLDKLASFLYLTFFPMVLLLSVLSIIISFFAYIVNIIEFGFFGLYLGLMLVPLLLIISLGIDKYLIDEVYSISETTDRIIVLLIGYFIWIFILIFAIIYPISNVMVDMDNNIYYLNETIIPIFIQITGSSTDLSINLYKGEIRNNLTQIDSIEYLNLNHNTDNIIYSKHLAISGNSLGNGRFNFYIKTNNLTSGYYELECANIKNNKIYINSFYLI